MPYARPQCSRERLILEESRNMNANRRPTSAGPVVTTAGSVPTQRPHNPVPAEGDGGVFSQSWFPICLAEQLAPGQVRGERFLDGKVVVYRTSDGIAHVVSAYCPHVGADLS